MTSYFYILTCTWTEGATTRTEMAVGTVALDEPTTRETVLEQIRHDAERDHEIPASAPVLFFSLERAEIGGEW